MKRATPAKDKLFAYIARQDRGFVVMIDGLAKNVFPNDYLALHNALRDLLAFYDRAAGNVRKDSGYTAADVKRLEEIRKLVNL